MAVHDRRIMQVYHLEAHNLSEAEYRRLRRAQRHYVEEWVPGGRAASARSRRRRGPGPRPRAIGAIQSILFHNSALATARLGEMLWSAAHTCLGVEPDAATVAVLDRLGEGA